jgi:hypothetical protein
MSLAPNLKSKIKNPKLLDDPCPPAPARSAEVQINLFHGFEIGSNIEADSNLSVI